MLEQKLMSKDTTPENKKQGEGKATTSRTAYYLIALGLLCLGGYGLYRRGQSNLAEVRPKNKKMTNEMPADPEELQGDALETEAIAPQEIEAVCGGGGY